MTILKAGFMYQNDPKTYVMDVIEHEGRFFLVPNWTVTPKRGWMAPDRLIPLDRLPHHQYPSRSDIQFALDAPIPRSVIEGPTSSSITAIYGVVNQEPYIKRGDRPPIWIHYEAGGAHLGR